MKKVYILSGVSGSGKSTLVDRLVAAHQPMDKRETEGHKPVHRVVSADHYFIEDGVYRFDPQKLSEAHGACFRGFIEALQAENDVAHAYADRLIVVDNTNTTTEEIAPYMLGAQAYGYEAEVRTLMCRSEDDVKVCAGRNAHGASFDTVLAQHRRILARRFPPWWKALTEEIPE